MKIAHFKQCKLYVFLMQLNYKYISIHIQYGGAHECVNRENDKLFNSHTSMTKNLDDTYLHIIDAPTIAQLSASPTLFYNNMSNMSM